jgi:hypothetical protein
MGNKRIDILGVIHYYSNCAMGVAHNVDIKTLGAIK